MANMANMEIRVLIEKYRLRHYEVSGALGISECTLSRWLRRELPPNKKEEIIETINRVANSMN